MRAPAAANPVVGQFTALVDLFTHYPILTPVHVVPGLLFMLLGPLPSISCTAPEMAPVEQTHFCNCGMVIGAAALVMSLGMPAIGGVSQAAATILFATSYLFALDKAFWRIRRREVATPHRIILCDEPQCGKGAA